MQQLNQVLLRGHVGNIRVQTVAGKQMARLSVATNYAYKSREGDPVVETTWSQVVAFEGPKMPDFSQIAKGTPVEVKGRLRSQRYTDADGVERTAYEILANQVTVVENTDSCGDE